MTGKRCCVVVFPRRESQFVGGINFLTESACAFGEMFLIKRPFSGCYSIRRRFQRYGKINKKEEFCEKARCS